MRTFKIAVVLGMALFVAACAGPGRNTDPNAPPNPHAGIYKGTETLTRGTFPIRVVIDPDGEIRLTDVDNITGYGQMEGPNFIIRRPRPYQVFEGTVEGDTITGTTHGNIAFGDGTFTAAKN